MITVADNAYDIGTALMRLRRSRGTRGCRASDARHQDRQENKRDFRHKLKGGATSRVVMTTPQRRDAVDDDGADVAGPQEHSDVRAAPAGAEGAMYAHRRGCLVWLCLAHMWTVYFE